MCPIGQDPRPQENPFDEPVEEPPDHDLPYTDPRPAEVPAEPASPNPTNDQPSATQLDRSQQEMGFAEEISNAVWKRDTAPEDTLEIFITPCGELSRGVPRR